MGQKSRSKKQQRPAQKQVARPVVAATAQADASAAPSLVRSSATFQPKQAPSAFSLHMGVERRDVRRIVLLMLTVAVLFAALVVADRKSSLTLKAGQAITRFMRF